MRIIIDIPDYSPDQGIKYKWEDGFEIHVKIDGQQVVISANKAGLNSLANHLINLAQIDIPAGHHMHLDEFNSLEQGSAEMIIEKI